MTSSTLSNNTVRRFSQAFQEKRFWPSWAVQAPLHQFFAEIDCFDVMWFISEPVSPRRTDEGEEAQGTAGYTACRGIVLVGMSSGEFCLNGSRWLHFAVCRMSAEKSPSFLWGIEFFADLWFVFLHVWICPYPCGKVL